MAALAPAALPRRTAVQPKASLAGAFLFWLRAVVVGIGACHGTHAMATGARALDGDTLVLSDRRIVRLIGINSPELGRDGRADEPLARAAKAHLQRLIERRAITLEYEAERYDHYGRTLAHARADNEDVQLGQLRAGFAFAVAVSPNTRAATRYFAAEAVARSQRRGVWGEAYFASRPAIALTNDATGFRRVHGKVLAVTRARHGIALTLAPNFTILVPHAASKEFAPPLAAFVGKMVHARGWIGAREQRLRMRIDHPAMLALVP